MKRRLMFLSILALAWCFASPSAFAQAPENPYPATIVGVEPPSEETGLTSYTVTFTGGPEKGKTVTVGNSQPFNTVGGITYGLGDKVTVDSYEDAEGQTQYIIAEYQRLGQTGWLLVLLVLVVVWLARWRGLRSLVGLAFSYVVLVYWLVPSIAQGGPPVSLAILAGAVILSFSLLVTEGFSRRTWAALAGMFATMIVIGILSTVAIEATHLTGIGSEDAIYLQNIGTATIDLRGLLLAGFLIGTLGILADVGVGQVAAVAELNQLRGTRNRRAIYRSAMRIGNSHLSAMIHTLVLAYAGSALPLLILFSSSGTSAATTLNSEVVATEVVRTVVGSIGIILALPLTTLAAIAFKVRPDSGPAERVDSTSPN